MTADRDQQGARDGDRDGHLPYLPTTTHDKKQRVTNAGGPTTGSTNTIYASTVHSPPALALVFNRRFVEYLLGCKRGHKSSSSHIENADVTIFKASYRRRVERETR